jgi:hypothetical protein
MHYLPQGDESSPRGIWGICAPALPKVLIQNHLNSLCNTCVARADNKNRKKFALQYLCCKSREIKTGRNTLCKYLSLQEQKFKTERILKFKVEIQSLKSEFDQRN